MFPDGESPTFAFELSRQVIWLLVPPEACDFDSTERSVSGVSSNESAWAAEMPEQSWFTFTVTECVDESFTLYPAGAETSFTSYEPKARWSTQAVPSAPVVTDWPAMEQSAPASACPFLADLRTLIAPSCCWFTY